jgi:hypothetical protein
VLYGELILDPAPAPHPEFESYHLYLCPTKGLLKIVAVGKDTIAIACSGYRVSARSGRHKVTFEAARVAICGEAAPIADYFETCRRKRNVMDYMTSSGTTDIHDERS